MMSIDSFKKKLAKAYRRWQQDDYDAALAAVEELQKVWPGNGQLSILWASLVQLQENPANTLDEAKQALQRAVELDRQSPAGPIELGHFLDSVEDDPEDALTAFAEGTLTARRLLIDGLLGQARALLQLDKKDDALACLMEALYLINNDSTSKTGKSANGSPDILVRNQSGRMLAFQLKGPFAMRIEDLLEELLPERSA